MLTPKEKAEDLFQLYLPFVESGHIEEIKYRCKLCALIAVDEIISEYGTYYKVNIDDKYVSYWQEVKQEIEKL
jgi:hypothetical protein